ncbi:metallophosphoesterase family protein [Streptomyces sp. SID11233]|nr:metallophosphoesterase family protein [Streptomyces sp. SID11233]
MDDSMVRFAVISDLHGNSANFRAITEAARGRVDAIVLTGDYLEAKISKKDMFSGFVWPPEDVVDHDADLWAELVRCVLVRGNQEERIATLLGGRAVPGLAPLLAAPERWSTPATRFEHGHRFAWARDGDALTHPVLDEEPGGPVVVHGHSHRRMLTFGRAAPDSAAPPGGPRRTVPVTGRVHRLPPHGIRVVNAGAACEAAAHWVLYDEDARTVTFETAGDTGTTGETGEG